MSQVFLGQFGDRRLEKGGPSCTLDYWRAARGVFACGGLEATELGRSA